MRQRIHYTPAQITTNLYTAGKEWALESGTEYRGLYHRYVTGEVYTEATWNPKISKKLVEYTDQSTDVYEYKKLKTIQTQFKTPTLHVPVVTTADRNTGFIMRYFLKKNNEPIFLEIDQAQYIDWTIKLLDANIYSAIEIKWIIAGNKQTQYVDQVLVPGAFEQNLMTLQQAELVMPGISAYITDPLQLYTDTEFLVPKDINA
jgi:hypothetical protein